MGTRVPVQNYTNGGDSLGDEDGNDDSEAVMESSLDPDEGSNTVERMGDNNNNNNGPHYGSADTGSEGVHM